MLARNLIRFIGLTLHRLNESNIVPDPHRTEAHVEIGETDPEQTQPRPKHVAAIETGHARVSTIACWRFRKLIQ
jgi:hypothetical protein